MRYLLLTLISFTLFTGCSTQQSQTVVVSSDANVNVVGNGVIIRYMLIEASEDASFESIESVGRLIHSEGHSEALAHEGFVVRVAPTGEVNKFLECYGNIEDHKQVFHGQIVNWRDVQQQEVSKQGMVVTFQDKPYAINDGYLSLLTRAFEMRREDGLYTYVQVVPTWHVPRGSSALIGDRQTPKRSKVFTELQFDDLLKDGESLLVVARLEPVAQGGSGPRVDGPLPVSLSEAVMGKRVEQSTIAVVMIESHLQIQ